MNPLLEVWLVAARDCRKNVRSVKGLVMFGIALLGAFVSTFRLQMFEAAMDDLHKFSVEQQHSMQAQLFSKLYGDEPTGDLLARAPTKLVVLFFIAVWITPLLVMIIGFDGISADLQYRSVRYWASRTRRPSYYVGKFLALWIIVGLIGLVMQLIICGVTIVRADGPGAETAIWGLRFWAASLPVTGAWCGVAVLTSSLFRTPMLSLLATCAAFFGLFLLGFIFGRVKEVAALKYLYPNNFDGLAVGASMQNLAHGVGVCLAYVVVTTVIGSAILTQRDV